MANFIRYCDAWHSCLWSDQSGFLTGRHFEPWCQRTSYNCDTWHLCLVDQLWCERSTTLNPDASEPGILWCLTLVSCRRSVARERTADALNLPANLEYCDARHSCLVEDQLPVSERQNPLSNPLIVNLRCRQTVNFYAREPPHDCDAWHLCLVDQLWIGRVPVNTSTMVKTCGHASEQ